MKAGATNLTVDKAVVERIRKVLELAGEPSRMATRFAEQALTQVCDAIEAELQSKKPLNVVTFYRLALGKPTADLTEAISDDLVGHLSDLIDAKLEERTAALRRELQGEAPVDYRTALQQERKRKRGGA